MSNEVAASGSTISGDFSFNYAGPKFTHECMQCGFKVDLYYGPGTEYECPFCKIEMCRSAQDLIWYQDCNSSWAALQQGFYGSEGAYHILDSGAPSPPMVDGYLFVRR